MVFIRRHSDFSSQVKNAIAVPPIHIENKVKLVLIIKKRRPMEKGREKGGHKMSKKSDLEHR